MIFERGVPLSEFARLTDAQIDEVLDHPRDAESKQLRPPPPPPRQLTLTEALMEVEMVAAAFGLSAEQRDEAFALVREKFGAS